MFARSYLLLLASAWNLSRFVIIYHDLSRFFAYIRNLSRFITIYHDLSWLKFLGKPKNLNQSYRLSIIALAIGQTDC